MQTTHFIKLLLEKATAASSLGAHHASQVEYHKKADLFHKDEHLKFTEKKGDPKLAEWHRESSKLHREAARIHTRLLQKVLNQPVKEPKKPATSATAKKPTKAQARKEKDRVAEIRFNKKQALA